MVSVMKGKSEVEDLKKHWLSLAPGVLMTCTLVVVAFQHLPPPPDRWFLVAVIVLLAVFNIVSETLYKLSNIRRDEALLKNAEKKLKEEQEAKQ